MPRGHYLMSGVAPKGDIMAKILISYSAEKKGIRVPSCAVWFGTLPAQVQFQSLGVIAPSIPDEILLSPNGVRIRFLIAFGKRRIVALARAWRPNSIRLHLKDPTCMIGTIHMQRDVVEHGCDLMCVPPAEELLGPGKCVVCKEGRDRLELCC
jgi:hypothetical protein